jgi:hypothetical protein
MIDINLAFVWRFVKDFAQKRNFGHYMTGTPFVFFQMIRINLRGLGHKYFSAEKSRDQEYFFAKKFPDHTSAR